MKPAKDVRPRDTIEISIGDLQWTVKVCGVSDKRGPASVAAGLYDETPESRAAREARASARRSARPLGADLGARPTKQDRRRLEALRQALERRRPGPG